MPSRRRALVAFVALTAGLVGCAGPITTEQVRPWRETPGAAAPPELSRFNDLLADLAETLKPALVHVRVRRGGALARDESEAPGEPRRSTGSGFVIEPTGLIAIR